MFEYIQWVRKTYFLFNSCYIEPNYFSGIAALRSIVDAFTDVDRIRVTKTVLLNYLPHQLGYIVITDMIDSLVIACPIEILPSTSSNSESENSFSSYSS
jgi:hypothetical protein